MPIPTAALNISPKLDIQNLTNQFNNQLKSSTQQNLVAEAFKAGANSNNLSNLLNKGLGSILKTGTAEGNLISNIAGSFKPSGLNIASLGLGAVGMGLDAFGVKKQDSETKTLFDKALGFTKYIPGVGGVIGGALDLLNQYGGKTSNKQGTDASFDTGAYSLQTNLTGKYGANKKHSFADTVKGWFGKSNVTKANEKTQRAEHVNLLAGNAAYGNNINNLAAANSMQDVLAKNQQALMGGVNLNILAAKKGAKINPAQLRTLVKKAKRGAKLQKVSFEDWYNTVPKDRNDTTSYNLRRAYELAPREELEKWRTATPEQLKDTTYHLKTFYWNDAGIGEFVKSKKHDTIQKEIDWYYSDKAKDFRNKYTLFDDDSDYYQYRPIEKFGEGGKMNVIPEGALHARKHNLPEEIAEKVTNKGIPVITLEEGGDIKQHAEIEVNEIIFNKETTDKLEDFFKKFNETEDKKDKDLIAVEAGKFLAFEILENTDDKTGLIETIE